MGMGAIELKEEELLIFGQVPDALSHQNTCEERDLFDVYGFSFPYLSKRTHTAGVQEFCSLFT